MERPTSVTVVAWVIIALSLESLLTLFSNLAAPILKMALVNNSFQSSTLVWLGASTAAIYIVLAVLILNRIAWARVVYVCFLGFGLIGMLIGGQQIILIANVIIKLVVFGFFLFTKEANEYFSATVRVPA